MWTHQYTTLSPRTCFVLDDGHGTAVGYVIGTPDVHAFARAYPRYVDEVLTRGHGAAAVPAPAQLAVPEPWWVAAVDPPSPPDGAGAGTGEGTPTPAASATTRTVNEACLAQLAHHPRWLLLEGVPGKAELAAAYRATMHIDLLDAYQGRGWGRKMIERFVESVGAAVAEADGALDPGRGLHIGVSGENTKVVPFYERVGFTTYPGGEAEGNVWMVRAL